MIRDNITQGGTAFIGYAQCYKLTIYTLTSASSTKVAVTKDCNVLRRSYSPQLFELASLATYSSAARSNPSSANKLNLCLATACSRSQRSLVVPICQAQSTKLRMVPDLAYSPMLKLAISRIVASDLRARTSL